MAYPAPSGYAPGGVSYYRSPKKKVYQAPTGYAPGGVEYGPLRRKPRKPISPDGWMFGRGLAGKGRGTQGKSNGRPIGTNQSGEIIYQDPDTGEIYTEAQRRVKEQNDPLLALISKREAEERARASADATAQSGVVSAAFDAEREPTKNLYDHAVTQAKAVEDAIASKFGKTGETNVAALNEKLAQIGGTAGSGETTDIYKGAEGANYAIGMNDVARLISRGAEAQNWLGREKITSLEDIQSSLMELLTDIGIDYGDQRSELEAGAPGQIQEMYDRLLAEATGKSEGAYERATAERDRKEEQRRYNAGNAAEAAQSRRDERTAERKYMLEQILAAEARGDKREADRLRRQDKLDERDWKTEQAQLDRDARDQNNRRSNQADPDSGPTVRDPSTSEKYITDSNGDVVRDAQGRPKINPNYIPPSKAKGNNNDTVGTAGSAKRNRVVQSAYNAVVNPNTGTIRERLAFSANPDMAIYQAINSAMEAQGVSPNSKVGIEIRRSIFKRIVGMRSGKGDKKTPPYRKPTWVKG